MFQGIITPIITPFHRDETQSINYEATNVLIDHLIQKGVQGIFILGSNGEFHVISYQEKIEFTKRVVRMVNGRVPVYVGTGCCSTQETVQLSKEAEALGADALSIITPYFIPPSEEELYQHFKECANSVQIPIILYNIPKNTGSNISASIVRRLADIDNIRGIKDSSGDIANLQAYMDATKGTDMSVLIGSDSKISQGYAMGATGAIAGTSNVITDTLVGLDRALRANDEEQAQRLQQDIEQLRAVLKLGTVPSIVKRAVELANIAEAGPARKPVKETSPETDQAIIKMLQYYGLH